MNVEDPIAAARIASAKIRQYDRPTQIREFLPSANKYLHEIHKFARSFRDKLDLFKLDVSYDSGTNAQFPPGLDRVSQNLLRIKLSTADGGSFRIIVYSVASLREQCEILRQHITRDNPRGHYLPEGEHEQLLWYDNLAEPDLNSIKANLESWLVTAVGELTSALIDE